jgi:predicted acylesterase/phospholipase RssA
VLIVEPASQPRPGRRIGVALAGGGPAGAFYEIGALHALSEALIGRDLTKLDVYVGVSSGALIAAALANGFDTTNIGSTYLDTDTSELGFSPQLLLQPAVGEYLTRLIAAPQAFAHALHQFASDQRYDAWSAILGSAGRLLPTALFDNRPFERHLRALFTTHGATNDFRKLHAPLYVVATLLDTGAPVVFGEGAFRHVPISRAVAASSALPGLFPPVQIGGRSYVDGALVRTMHASLALDAGCNLVICINPLVPFDASKARRGRYGSVAAAGLPAILSQTFRTLIHSRMQVGMASYRDRFPGADQLLLEPDAGDERMFFTNVFRYSGRHRLIEYAYQRTRRDLLTQANTLRPLLERHGLQLNLRLLRMRRRSFLSAQQLRLTRARKAIPGLWSALDRLERTLPAVRAGG